MLGTRLKKCGHPNILYSIFLEHGQQSCVGRKETWMQKSSSKHFVKHPQLLYICKNSYVVVNKIKLCLKMCRSIFIFQCYLYFHVILLCVCPDYKIQQVFTSNVLFGIYILHGFKLFTINDKSDDLGCSAC